MGLKPVILIPAYNPDEKLLALLPELREKFDSIVIVDDGSTTGKEIFSQPLYPVPDRSSTARF